MGDWLKLAAYRERLFEAITRALKIDGHCKSYEGALEILAPSAFGGDWSIELHCYVLGPHRHYTFAGATLSDCVDKANDALDTWIDELVEQENEAA